MVRFLTYANHSSSLHILTQTVSINPLNVITLYHNLIKNKFMETSLLLFVSVIGLIFLCVLSYEIMCVISTFIKMGIIKYIWHMHGKQLQITSRTGYIWFPGSPFNNVQFYWIDKKDAIVNKPHYYLDDLDLWRLLTGIQKVNKIEPF